MSGKPLEIKTYKNNKLNGPYKLFKQQGLDTHGEYADNLKTGYWVEHKFSQGGPDEGTYVNGEKTGAWKLGATNLFGKCKGEFIKNLKHGTWEYWNLDGNKWKTEKWDNGKLIN